MHWITVQKIQYLTTDTDLLTSHSRDISSHLKHLDPLKSKVQGKTPHDGIADVDGFDLGDVFCGSTTSIRFHRSDQVYPYVPYGMELFHVPELATQTITKLIFLV